MGFVDNLTKKRWQKEGADKPVPTAGLRLYLFLLSTHFWKLVRVNLLFLAFCLPVFTIPAALCGLNRVLIRLVREGNCFVWPEFRQEFKQSLFKRLPLGLLFGCGLFAAYYLLSLGLSNWQSLYGLLFFALGLAALYQTALHGAWAFALAAMLDLSNRDLLKNARCLAALEGKRSLGIAALCIAHGLLLLLLFPVSLLFGVTLSFSFTRFSICFLIDPPVQARVIGPYEAGRSGGQDV